MRKREPSKHQKTSTSRSKTVLQRRDAASLSLQDGGFYVRRPPHVHPHADVSRRVGHHPPVARTLTPDLSQPGQAVFSLDSAGRVSALSLRSWPLLFHDALSVTPAGATPGALLDCCICIHRLRCRRAPHRLLVEPFHWSCGRLKLWDTVRLGERVRTK